MTTTMFTLMMVVLGLGYTRQFEDAYALSVGIGNTPDHRARFDKITFTDGVTCDTLIQDVTVTYNTYNEAVAAWTSFKPPFKTTRGRNLFVNSEKCVAMTAEKIPTFPTLLIYALIAPAVLLDFCILKSCCDCYEARVYYASRQGRVQPRPGQKETDNAMESV